MDLLRDKARAMGIKVVYTSNKRVFMSASIRESDVVLRVHRIFRGCPEEIAEAIIGYCTQPDFNEFYRQIIERHVTETLGTAASDIVLKSPVSRALDMASEPHPRVVCPQVPDGYPGSRPKGIEVEAPIQAVFRIEGGKRVEQATDRISVPESKEIHIEIRLAGKP